MSEELQVIKTEETDPVDGVVAQDEAVAQDEEVIEESPVKEMGEVKSFAYPSDEFPPVDGLSPEAIEQLESLTGRTPTPEEHVLILEEAAKAHREMLSLVSPVLSYEKEEGAVLEQKQKAKSGRDIISKQEKTPVQTSAYRINVNKGGGSLPTSGAILNGRSGAFKINPNKPIKNV